MKTGHEIIMSQLAQIALHGKANNFRDAQFILDGTRKILDDIKTDPTVAHRLDAYRRQMDKFQGLIDNK